jgi:hypothetical protein
MWAARAFFKASSRFFCVVAVAERVLGMCLDAALLRLAARLLFIYNLY